MTNNSSSLECIQTLYPPPSSSLSSIERLLPKQSVSVAWQCKFSSNHKYLAVCYGEPNTKVAIFRTSDWSLWKVLESGHDRTVRSIDFAPCMHHHQFEEEDDEDEEEEDCGLLLATGSFDGSVCIWEYFSSEWEITAQLEGHESEVKNIKWNRTGSLLASCGRDRSLWIWECLLPNTIGGAAAATTGAPGGGGGEEVEFECVAVLQGHEADVKDLLFTRSHGYWGSGDEILFSSSYDNTIKLWAEDDDGEWFHATTLSPNVHSSTIWSIATAPGGVRLVSASADCTVAVWKFYTPHEYNAMKHDKKNNNNNDHDDVDHEETEYKEHGVWKCICKLPQTHERVVYSVDCAPSNAGHGRIVSAGADDSICVYKEIGGVMTNTTTTTMTTNKKQQHYDHLQQKQSSSSSSPSSSMFVVDACVKNAHNGDVNYVKWSPYDGRILVSAGDDGLVKIWKYHST